MKPHRLSQDGPRIVADGGYVYDAAFQAMAANGSAADVVGADVDYVDRDRLARWNARRGSHGQ